MRDASFVPSVLLDARELARMMAISVPTVWRWRGDGRLPPAISLTAQCVRWNRATVLDWIERGCPPQNNNGSDVVAPEPSVIRQSPVAKQEARA